MERWIDVPVGVAADRWVTRPGCRTVVVLVHSVACGDRLLDVVGLFRSDLRIQVVFTAAPSAFPAGVEEFLASLGGVVLPWEQVARMRFDLAVAAGTGGLERVHAPVVLLPHGVGFGKRPVAAVTGGGPAGRETYGLGRQWLVRAGRVIPSVLVLAHQWERERLAATCPEAVEAVLVAGDPVVDRLAASAGLRAVYRKSLGLDTGDRLVVVASTWGRSSLLGARADVLWRLVREAQGTRWRVVLLAHPNVWAGHGVWQVRAWLADLAAAGLGVVGPFGEWRSVLVAVMPPWPRRPVVYATTARGVGPDGTCLSVRRGVAVTLTRPGVWVADSIVHDAVGGRGRVWDRQVVVEARTVSDGGWLGSADVLVGAGQGSRCAGRAWVEDALAAWPGCAVAAAPGADDQVWLAVREGTAVRVVRAVAGPDGPPTGSASTRTVLLPVGAAAWLATGYPLDGLRSVTVSPAARAGESGATAARSQAV